MPAPANDNWANATVISGAPGWLNAETNVNATAETSEPGHYKYNPGPIYPVTNTIVGPWNTVWYSWTCPTSGNYYFSTRSTLYAFFYTTFATTLSVFVGTALNNLIRVATLMDQGVGDGNGVDFGASVAFAAVAGTTYYIQIDSRVSGATGIFHLQWDLYQSQSIGSCGDNVLNFNTGTVCYGSIQITDVTTDGFYPFGTFPAAPGIFAVRYVYGKALLAGCATSTTAPCGIILDANFGAFIRWQDYNQNSGLSYSPGQLVAGSVFGEWCGAAIAAQAVPAFAPVQNDNPAAYGTWPGTYWNFQSSSTPIPSGTFQGGAYGYYPYNNYTPGDYYGFNPTSGPYVVCVTACPAHEPGSDSGVFWTVLPTYGVPAVICSETLVPYHNASRQIGIIAFGNSSSTNSAQNPSYQLVYYPLTMAQLSTSFPNFSARAGTTWTAAFPLQNLTANVFDGCTIELLNTGGITGASAAVTGITLPASGGIAAGPFTFTADPTAQLVTATLRLSRNGVVACTIDYPLYPAVAAAYSYVANFERNCGSYKVWHNRLALNLPWNPPVGGLWPYAINYSITAAGYNISSDGSPCAIVSALTGTFSSATTVDVDIQATSVAQTVPTQCAFSYEGFALPTFSKTITIPPA